MGEATGPEVTGVVDSPFKDGYPLAPGGAFKPGDGTAGFIPFAAWLRTLGYAAVSQDTYDPADEPIVYDYQRGEWFNPHEPLRLLIDGIVGPQTWSTIGVFASRTTHGE